MDSDPGVIGRGVRQGFPISASLFSIYAASMMIEALEDMKKKCCCAVGQLFSDVRFQMIKVWWQVQKWGYKV